MPRPRTILPLALIAGLPTLAVLGCAGSATTNADGAPAEDAPGLRVGDTVPAVTLVDESGQTVDLASLYAEQPLVVVFYRGGWCPFCRKALRDWRTHVGQVSELGARFVAITPEAPDFIAQTKQQNDLDYTVLGDPTHAAAKAFKVDFTLEDDTIENYKNLGIDLQTRNADGAWELPAPGTFIVDRDGVVRYAFADWNYKRRASPETVIEALREVAD